jgi:tetratricopeptide (TPR) repeat protein
MLPAPYAAAGPAAPELSAVCAASGIQVPGQPGTKLIALIGGPGALPDPAVLEKSLPGVRVVSCALKAGGRGMEEALSGALRYRPDLAVVLGADLARPAGPDGFYLRSKKTAYRLLKKIHIDRSVPADNGLAARAERLRAVAALARANKTPLLFCTLPLNLKGQPPASYLLPENEFFAAGLLELEQSGSAAAARFEMALKNARGNPLAEFYLAKALEAKGSLDEARAHYAEALNRDLWQELPSPMLNAEIRKAAAGSGTGLCDLEGAFLRVSSNGLSGFDQFSYGARWRPAYEGLVWGEIAGAARAAGLAWFAYAAPSAPPAALAEKDYTETLAAAAAALGAYPAGGPSALAEPAVAAFGFVEARKKGLAGRFIAAGKDLGGAGRPLLLAHLAEASRRLKDGRGALPQARLALAAEPANPRFRLLRDLCLLGSDHRKEAKGDLPLLFSEPAARTMAIAAARVYGLLSPGAPEPAVPSQKEVAASKKLADAAVAKLMSGDRVSSGRLLAEALKINPLNAEALMSLCSLKYSAGELRAALAACDGVPGATAERYPDSWRGLTADSLRMKAMVYFKLGRPAAAAAALRTAIAAAPEDWGGLAPARAELRIAEGF